MASNHVCLACRHVVRQQLHQSRQIPSVLKAGTTNHTLRPFSTNNPLSAVQAQPLPYKSKNPSPPTSSSIAEASGAAPPENEKGSLSSSSPARSVAQELRKRASSVTETYVAYGVCERLVKECARQADYSIPQAREKGVEVPKTKDGEDLGVGTGWWFESTSMAIPLT